MHQLISAWALFYVRPLTFPIVRGNTKIKDFFFRTKNTEADIITLVGFITIYTDMKFPDYNICY